jgi:uncharacterized protein YbaP (TraB family)
MTEYVFLEKLAKEAEQDDRPIVDRLREHIDMYDGLPGEGHILLDMLLKEMDERHGSALSAVREAMNAISDVRAFLVLPGPENVSL